MLTLHGNGNAATERQCRRGSRKQLRKRKRIRINVMLETRRKSTDYTHMQWYTKQKCRVTFENDKVKCQCYYGLCYAGAYSSVLSASVDSRTAFTINDYSSKLWNALVTFGMVGVERGGGASKVARQNIERAKKWGRRLLQRSKGDVRRPVSLWLRRQGPERGGWQGPKRRADIFGGGLYERHACRADQNVDANLESRAAICSGVAK